MVELHVITVPAFESDDNGKEHTAYTVHDEYDGCLRASAGWTLRDAIEYFASAYKVQRNDIVIARPFLPQEIYLQRCGVLM